jgi:hypothetical protein
MRLLSYEDAPVGEYRAKRETKVGTEQEDEYRPSNVKSLPEQQRYFTLMT